MTQDQETFLKLVAGPALKCERDTGIPACVTVAQAILESAAKGADGHYHWGASRLFTQANNPFGIKLSHLHSAEAYGEYDIKTQEIGADGQLHFEIDAFAKYAYLDNAFLAHALLFQKAPRYKPARNVRGDWQAFAVAIMECGYSTDRPSLCKIPGCIHYAGKLIKLVQQYKLDDHVVLSYYATAPVASNSEAQGVAAGSAAPTDVATGDL